MIPQQVSSLIQSLLISLTQTISSLKFGISNIVILKNVLSERPSLEEVGLCVICLINSQQSNDSAHFVPRVRLSPGFLIFLWRLAEVYVFIVGCSRIAFHLEPNCCSLGWGQSFHAVEIILRLDKRLRRILTPAYLYGCQAPNLRTGEWCIFSSFSRKNRCMGKCCVRFWFL